MSGSDHLSEDQFRIKTKLRRGYELPGWHQREHASLVSAQNEVAKLHQWDPDRTAIQNILINPVTPKKRR